MSENDNSGPTFSPFRRWGIALNVGLGIVAALALAGMANYLSARHHWRFQLARHSRVELFPETVRVLHSLTNDVKVIVFFNTSHEEDLYGLLAALLKEYSNVNPRIQVDTVDPTRQPARAALVLATYKLTALGSRDFVVIDCGGRVRVIYKNELADVRYEPGRPDQPLDVRHVAFNGQALFTTAIYNLAHPDHFKIGFTQGELEHDPDGPVGDPLSYSKFAQALKEKTNAEWEKVSLLGTNEIPADCQLLVIAGPHQAFSEAALLKIDAFLKQGGRLFALLSNPSRGEPSGLETLLAMWGVKVGSRFILDQNQSPSRTGYDLLTTWMDPDHPVTKALLAELTPLCLVLPRAIGSSRAGTPPPDAPRVDVLFRTSDHGVEVSESPDGVPHPNSLLDRTGTFPLAVAVEQGGIQGVSAERGATRIIVVGDSLCLDNKFIDAAPGNHYFATLAVNWLLDRQQILLEGLVPQPLKSYQLLMTDRQLQNSELVLLGAVPGGILFVGALVWWRRRH